MDIEEQSKGIQSNGNLQLGSGTSLDVEEKHIHGLQLKKQVAPSNINTLKVRKPYTISKQREKWTEEEHKKFIEALKLYGRAWKRIEEHVGTKTAVQIRSHAQKFFSKVVRESNTTDTSPVKSIQIPPPRPKRKPLHPYPRKMVASSKKESLVAELSIRSNSPNFSISEPENQSPTSVFSAVGSEVYDMTGSNTQIRSPSPDSSANGVKSSCFSLSEAPNLSLSGSGSRFSDQLTDSLNLNEQVFTKLELFPQDSVPHRTIQLDATPKQTLKLFGNTVLVSDSYVSSSLAADTCKSSPCNVNDPTSVCTSGYILPVEVSSQLSCVPHGGAQYSLHIPVPVKADLFFISHGRKFQKEDGSWNTTISRSVNWEMELCTQSCPLSSNSEDNKQPPKLLRMLSDNASSTKGFVPYKRCLAGRDAQTSVVTDEEREEQRTRLCL